MPEQTEDQRRHLKHAGQVEDYHPEVENAPPDFVAHIQATVGQCMFIRTAHWPARYRSRHPWNPPELVYPSGRVNTDLGGVVQYAIVGAYCFWRWQRS